VDFNPPAFVVRTADAAFEGRRSSSRPAPPPGCSGCVGDPPHRPRRLHLRDLRRVLLQGPGRRGRRGGDSALERRSISRGSCGASRRPPAHTLRASNIMQDRAFANPKISSSGKRVVDILDPAGGKVTGRRVARRRDGAAPSGARRRLRRDRSPAQHRYLQGPGGSPAERVRARGAGNDATSVPGVSPQATRRTPCSVRRDRAGTGCMAAARGRALARGAAVG